MKKLLAILLVLVMAIGLMPTVFADEATAQAETKTYSITITPNDNFAHTYEAYQIFKGDLTETQNDQGNVTSKVLTNIEWGNAVDRNDLARLMTFINDKAESQEGGLTKDSTAADYAEAIGSLNLTKDEDVGELAKLFEDALNDNVEPTGSVTTTGDMAEGKIDGLSAGYYLVKDKDNSLVGENGEEVDAAYTRYILSIVGDVIVKAKSEKPTIEKKVWDVNDSNSEATEPKVENYQGLVSDLWADSADHDIGDTVWYKVTFTIPANTLNNYDTYTLTITDTLSKGLTFDAESSSFTRLIADKECTDNALYFDVTSKDNEDGTTTLTLITKKDDETDLIKMIPASQNLADEYVFVWTYSCTLNEDAVIGSKGNPNKVYLEYSNNPNGDGMGKTEEDVNIVFTYQVDVSKVDGEKKPLEGAEFALFKKIKGSANTDWEKWAEGTEFEAERTYYTENTNGTYWLYLGTITPAKSDDDSSATGSYKGIDDGVYKLVETKTPDGYNSIEPIEFTVNAEHADDPEVLQLSQLEAGSSDAEFTVKSFADGDVTCDNAIVATTIMNKAGSTLPETGGIGTTIFYTVGGILVVAAVILLVTKKRMSAED